MVFKQEDFNNIGVMAVHCNDNKLQIAIDEAFNFDLCIVFKDCHIPIKRMILKVLEYDYELPDNPIEPPTEIEKSLVFGNSFEHDDKPYDNMGLKKGLLYYSYARYLTINGWNDSATGMKDKNFSFSVPKSQQEIEQFANKYRNMAKVAMLNT